MNTKEYRRGNQKWTIHRNWQHWVHKTGKKETKQKHNTLCVGHHYTTTNTCNIKQYEFVGKYIISKLHIKFICQNFNNVPVGRR